MDLPDSSILTNIQVPGHTTPGNMLFEKKYIVTRGIENRLYTDEELMKLPDISAGHTHYKEWQARKSSSLRLLRYLAARKKPLDILEVGCGNGWLSHQFAEIPNSEVTGLDINFTELQQAARVFSGDPNLHFIQGDIRSGILGDQRFDCIVFSDTIQYFPYLKKILHFALYQLKSGGEIHIIGSHFYRSGEIEPAKRRTSLYYSSLGYPEMADFYFHHAISDLRSFHHTLLYNPGDLWNRFLGRKDPFPWIRVKR
ncbi:MAG TPA: class I SAM-dependent methyltransferase [Puia sp.]|nr:class I SAM-dependent methyltransferase [Puia sp.]